MAQDFFGRHCLRLHKNSVSVLWIPTTAGRDLSQCSRNFQDCRKSLHKVTYLHQFHSLLTHNCPSQRRERPEKSPSPAVQRKATFREILFQLKNKLFKTLVLHYYSSSWARSWLLLTTLSEVQESSKQQPLCAGPAETGMDVMGFQARRFLRNAINEGWTWGRKGILFALLELVTFTVLYIHGKGRRWTP